MGENMTQQDTSSVELEKMKPSELHRIEESRFDKDMELVIQESEEMRIKRMMQHRTRGFIAANLSILSMLIGVGGFGWYFLMEAQLVPAFSIFLLALVPPLLMGIWAKMPLKTYIKEYKTVFMPKMANALNGMSFHPSRGVSQKILGRLAILPAFDTYKAEDCFMGMYKGVKVIFSEARLYSKSHSEGAVFDGIFVLLETPEEVIDGHTIITANTKMVKAFSKTRWKKMNPVHVSVSNPKWDKFHIYSTKPDSAELMIGEKLIKELAETAEVFDNAQISASLFGKKYIFICIPYDKDMFEASNLFVPVTTKAQALKVKKEIEQLLEIIDIFDVYKPIKS